MGRKVKCPYCGHEFFIHGYEQLETCYECNSEFNPRKQSHPVEVTEEDKKDD